MNQIGFIQVRPWRSDYSTKSKTRCLFKTSTGHTAEIVPSPLHRFPFSTCHPPVDQQFNTPRVDISITVLDFTGTDESKVINAVLPIIATVITSFRLSERMRQGRLWLDDAWAIFAMIFNIGLMTADWLYLRDYGNHLIYDRSELR